MESNIQICCRLSQNKRVSIISVFWVMSFLLLVLVLPPVIEAQQTAFIKARDGVVYQIRFRKFDPNDRYYTSNFINNFSVYDETGQEKLCLSTENQVAWELYTAARAIAQTQRNVPVFDTSKLAEDLKQSAINLGIDAIVGITIDAAVEILITDTALEDLNVVSILTGAPTFLIKSVSIVAGLGSIEIKMRRMLYAYSIASRYATIAQHLQKLANHHAPLLLDAINNGEVFDFPNELKGELVDYSDEAGLFEPFRLQLIAQVYQDYAEKAAEYGKVLGDNPDVLDVTLDVLGIGSFLNFIDAFIDFSTDKNGLDRLNDILKITINSAIDRNIQLVYDNAELALRLNDFCSPGIVLNLPEEISEGESISYTLVLNSPPDSTVTITITSDNPDITFAPSILTFSKNNWYIPQTVGVRAAQDNDTEDEITAITFTATGYSSSDTGVSINNQHSIRIIDTDEFNPPSPEGVIPTVSLTLEGGSHVIDVAPYFSSESNLEYQAGSTPRGIVTGTISGSVITIIPESPGSTTIVVTARDTVTGLTAIQTIPVSVRESQATITRPTNTDPPYTPTTTSNPRAEGLREGVSVIVDGLASGNNLRVREGAGTNYETLGLVTNGDYGIITDGPRFSGDHTWWEIDWDTERLDGWSAEVVGGVQLLFRRPPDLEIRDLDVSDSEVSPGERIELEIEIRNNGPGASAATDVYIYYSENRHSDLEELRDDSDLRGGWKLSVPSIRERRTETLTYRVDTPTELDSYYYGALLPNNIHPSDNTDHLDEDSIRNNLAREERVQVVGSPDYIVESISLSRNNTIFEPGDSFRLEATVRNIGTAEPRYSATLNYYRSNDARISTSDKWVDEDSVIKLEPEETRTRSASLTAPSEPGVYYYGACISDVRNESDRSNNCSGSIAITVRNVPTPVEVSGSPDLIVTLSSNSNLVDPNEYINLTANIRNQGDADASNSTTLRYYLSTDATVSSDDQLLATDSVRILTEGSSDNEDHGVRAPTQPGRHYYYACVDSITDEEDTTNNCSNFILINVRGSDLVVESPSVDLLGQTGGIDPNGEFVLNATIRNQGTGNAASTTVRYYISADQTFSTTNDSEAQTDNVSSINAGALTTVQSSRIRAPWTSGIFYCFICVDSLSNETDTSNNCSEPIQITIRNVSPRAQGRIPNQALNVGTTKSLGVANYFTDANNDTLNYTANSSDVNIATVTASGSQVIITPKKAGSATITVTASDGSLSATQTFSVSVTVPNRAPTAVGTIAAQTLTIGEAAKVINVSANFSDPDNDTLRFTAASNKRHIATATASGSQITITPVSEGNATITVTASDGKLSATQRISVSVVKANKAPLAVGTIAAQTLTIGEAAKVINVSANFSDPDNDTLRFTAASNKRHIATATASGSQITITPVSEGNATITVTASDGKLSATQTFSVSVVKANRAPLAVGTISARTLTVGDPAIQIDVSSNFSDPDGDTLNYTANSDNNSVATTTASGSIVSISPVAAGSATITVIASDGEFSATQTVSVTVTAAPIPNRAPVTVGAISSQTMTVGDAAITIDVSSNFSDPDGDTLNYTANSNNDSVATASASGSIVTITPIAAGSATITVTASDGELSATQTVSVTVTAASIPNRAPITVGTISARTLTVGDSAIQIDVSSNFSDPDGDTLNYTANSNNDSVATASASGSIVTITPIAAGSATITVTASDGELTAIQTVSVTVTAAPIPNRAPITVGAIADRTLTVGDAAITIDVSSNFSDPDGDSLEYTANSDDDNVATASASGSIVTIRPIASGSVTITVAASDGELKATQTISIAVTSGPLLNRAPIAIGSIPDWTLTEEDSFITIAVVIYFRDPDGDFLRYNASSENDNVAIAYMSGIRVKITPVGVGNTTITVEASDGEFTATQEISITVTAYSEDNWMPDLTLRAKVRDQLGLHTDEILTQQVMTQLTSLHATHSGITNLTGLEHAVNLLELSLSDNQIHNISPLQNLSNLTSLGLWDNHISDIVPLQNLTNLKVLDLRDNRISDISPLQNLTALTRLHPGDNPISDISPLQGLTNLTNITLSRCRISDLTPLQNLTKLSVIDAAGNQISDISPLQGLTNLSYLQLGSNQISDISPLQGLTNLSYLQLGSNQISDISALQNLTNLTKLFLSDNNIIDITPLDDLNSLIQLVLKGNPITDSDTIRRIKGNNPNLTIDINPPETVGSIPDQNLILGGTTKSLNVEQYFRDTESFTLHYSVLSNNESVVTAVVSGGIVTMTPQGVGNAIITVIGSDGMLTATQTISVSVISTRIGNRAPTTVGTISALTLTTGDAITSIDVSGYFEDPDDDNLNYDASSSDDNIASANSSDSQVRITPLAEGVVTITITASDGILTATQTVSVTVNEALPEDTWMPDTNLRTAIRITLDLQTGETLTQQAMTQLTSLATRNINNLKGLEYASNITSIYIRNGQINDIGSLQNLTLLTRLELISCQVSGITALQNLTNLTYIDLNNNQVSDITALQNLANLTYLNLWKNQVSDITALQNLTNLTYLNLWENQVSDITALQNLTNLTYLNLSSNYQISDITALEDLTALETLSISPRQVSDMDPLEDLTNLTGLRFTHSQISDISVLESMTNLTSLSLVSNEISDFSPLGDLASLTTLNIIHNPITDYTPLRTLKENNPSMSIDINLDNNIPEFMEGDSTTRSVAENITSGMNIGTEVSATDRDNDTLTYSLGGADASSFNIVSSSGQLQTSAALDYETKTSYSVTIRAYDYNSAADFIDVTINVTNINEGLLSDRTQQVQDAIVAAVDGVDSAADITATHLATITSLNLSSKSIPSLNSGDFTGLTALTSLILSYNDLTSLPSNIFDGLTALTSLILSYNDLTSLPSDIFDELDALTNLNLFNNDLTSLPSDIFDELDALTSLTLSNNDLTSLPSDIFDELDALTSLNLSNIDLTSLPSDIFDELDALTSLILSYNDLTSLPSDIFDELDALTSLTLSNNDLSNLPSDIFDELTALTQLTLSNNDLSSLPSGIFHKLTELTRLTLSNNDISDVSELEGLTSLVYLRLTGNPVSDYGPLRRLIAAIEADGRSLSLDITIPPGAPAKATPTQTSLLPNYPNPFNPETWIPYQLSKPTEVTLTIYNVQGVVVRKLALGHRAAGVYYSRNRAAHWDGKNNLGEKVSGGVYFVKFKAGNYTKIRKMLIRK